MTSGITASALSHRTALGGSRLRARNLASEETGRLRGLRIVTPLRAILDGIETHVRRELIEQAIQTAEQQSLITADGAARARNTLAERNSGSHP
jgi:hypothetical protein